MVFLRNIGHFISQKGNTLKEALMVTTFLIEGLKSALSATGISFFLKKGNLEVMLKVLDLYLKPVCTCSLVHE